MLSQEEQEIEFLGEKKIKIKPGQTILDAALEAGLPHFNACGGNAECSTCRIRVIDGIDRLSPVNDLEANLRKAVPFPPRIRLACQTCVISNPVTVKRIIVDRTKLSRPIKKKISKFYHKLGEKKELVLFFLDIRNFTPFVETFLPFDVIHVMRGCYIIFNDFIKQYNGVIIDTSGDGFYAVFGLQGAISDAANNAIEAGHSILKEFRTFNETYLEPYFGIHLEIGIGVHAGQVIVGEVMIGHERHLSVMGLAVNVASRIQGSTKRLNNNFIASEQVMKMSAHYYSDHDVRELNLRGIHGVFRVHLIGSPYEPVIQ